MITNENEVDYVVPMANIATPLYQGITTDILEQFQILLSKESDYKNWYYRNYNALQKLSKEYIEQIIETYCTEEINTYVSNLYNKSISTQFQNISFLPTSAELALDRSGTSRSEGTTIQRQPRRGTIPQVAVMGGTIEIAEIAQIAIFIVSVSIYLFSITTEIHELQPQLHKAKTLSEINKYKPQIGGKPPIVITQKAVSDINVKKDSDDETTRLVCLIGIANKKYIYKITPNTDAFRSEIAIYKELNNISDTNLKNQIISLYDHGILSQSATNIKTTINNNRYKLTKNKFPEIFNLINKITTSNYLYYVLEYEPENIVLYDYLRTKRELTDICSIIFSTLHVLFTLNLFNSFCHMDLHHNNLLISTVNNQIKFFDFDLAFTKEVNNNEFVLRMIYSCYSNPNCLNVVKTFQNHKYKSGFCYDVINFVTIFNETIIEQCATVLENDNYKIFFKILHPLHQQLISYFTDSKKIFSLESHNKYIIKLMMANSSEDFIYNKLENFFYAFSDSQNVSEEIGGAVHFYNKYKKYKDKYLSLKSKKFL